MQLRILRKWRKEPIGRSEHMLIGGSNPYRWVSDDTLQYRENKKDEWTNVPVEACRE